MNFCKSLTKKNINCKNKCIKDTEFCKIHSKSQNNKYVMEKPNECIVCLEPLNVKKSLSCGHWIHLNCIYKWGKAECPICRKKIKLSKLQLKSFNIYKRERELEFLIDMLRDMLIDGLLINVEDLQDVLDNIEESPPS